MILALVLVSVVQQGHGYTKGKATSVLGRIVNLLSGAAPTALGRSFRPE
jgi:hypothetical protein